MDENKDKKRERDKIYREQNTDKIKQWKKHSCHLRLRISVYQGKHVETPQKQKTYALCQRRKMYLKV